VLLRLLCTIVRFLLSLRYRVSLRGVRRVSRRGTGGILFLPNHPALIDPVILVSHLSRFAPRALADRDQVGRPVIRQLARLAGVIALPDIKVYGRAVRDEIEAARQTCIDTLRTGGNVLLYPSGHIYRTRLEDLRGNSAASDIVQAVPDVRIVLVRTRGLWGSCFSLAGGAFPHLGRLVWPLLRDLLGSYLFFMPRRAVTVELFEPEDLPRTEGRRAFNAYLERYYNQDAPYNTHVAHALGAEPERCVQPEPTWGGPAGALEQVPATVRQRVQAHLAELSGVADLRDQQHLANDLGLDSLARAELLLWLTREFGSTEQDGDALTTVGDVLLAACGQAVVTRPTPITPPPRRWFAGDAAVRIEPPVGATVTQAFLNAARRDPGRVIIADQISGARTYRDLVTAILALRPHIERLEGTHVGIMLPASVAATTLYWAALFAGKTPVMVNWTTGARNVAHSLDLCGVQQVLTSRALLQRLEAQGVELDAISGRLLPIEEIGKRITRGAKLRAAVCSRLCWSALERVQPADQVVVLVTSGSESLPKAVPLTHTNVLTNIADVINVVDVRASDRMIGFLPPFHSFGLTVTVVAPAVLGFPVVYHANPTEAPHIARLIAAYKATFVLGTPTFLRGILQAVADPKHLASLRFAVTGAEKCPSETYAAFARLCPEALVLEGYGITECSPIVAVNRPPHPRAETIGPVLPSVEHVVVDPESGTPVSPGQRGMLLVRGPSIFGGYLGDDVASPFVEHDGKSWYRTGDLVVEDRDGVLTFAGRLKRFVKIGGEMVSLPAVEAALSAHYAEPDDEGPALAVTATADETRPELVLLTTRDIDRAEANQHIRAAGLSGLHNISRVMQIEEIPLLGNGKTDYRTLARRIADA
jgi:long-chain-fatty-acid--[acyl-carrier-protein] ligase